MRKISQSVLLAGALLSLGSIANTTVKAEEQHNPIVSTQNTKYRYVINYYSAEQFIKTGKLEKVYQLGINLNQPAEKYSLEPLMKGNNQENPGHVADTKLNSYFYNVVSRVEVFEQAETNGLSKERLAQAVTSFTAPPIAPIVEGDTTYFTKYYNFFVTSDETVEKTTSYIADPELTVGVTKESLIEYGKLVIVVGTKPKVKETVDNGVKTYTTTTYTLNEKTGELTSNVTKKTEPIQATKSKRYISDDTLEVGKTTEETKESEIIVKVGTKPKTETVSKDGKEVEKVTTYTVNATTGELTEVITEKEKAQTETKDTKKDNSKSETPETPVNNSSATNTSTTPQQATTQATKTLPKTNDNVNQANILSLTGFLAILVGLVGARYKKEN